MKDAAERRRFHRIPFDSNVFLVDADQRHETRLIDISLRGALVVLPPGWKGAPGDHLHMELTIGEGDLMIHMDMEIAHAGKDRLGLACRHIDLDSMMHLRRLVELNLGDAEQLNRELNSLGDRD